jgi:ribosomal protein S12 methylthiotransferase accessory factor
MEIRSIKIVNGETGSRSLHPLNTLEKTSTILQKIGVEKVELIDLKYTDNIPIFRVNEAGGKWYCHRALYYWSRPPSPLNKPPREFYGKGITIHQSRASAIMEAIERYCAQIFPHSRVIHASYEEVEKYAIHPSSFSLPKLIPPKCWYCMERGFRCFHDLNDVCYEWTWGFSLIRRKPVLVPASLVYYPYMSRSGVSFMFNDTGGLASGNTLEEAILSGLAEVVERDALYNTFNSENIDNIKPIEINDLNNKYIMKFFSNIPQDRVFIFLIENKVKINIPTVVAFICYVAGGVGIIFGGSGTHLELEVALLRAITEMEQQKVRKKILMEFNKNNLLSSRNPPINNTTSIKQIYSKSTGDLGMDIDLYLKELSKNNMDAIVVDLTHPDIGIPTVRVIVPELISYSGIPIRESFLINIMGAKEKLHRLF